MIKVSNFIRSSGDVFVQQFRSPEILTIKDAAVLDPDGL